MDEERSFCVVMRSELLTDCCMILPVPSKSFIEKGTLTLVMGSTGYEWEIEFEPISGNCSMIRLAAAGWHAFCSYNLIVPGDCIVFELKSGKRFSVLIFGGDGIEKEVSKRITWATRRARVHHKNPHLPIK